MSVASDVGNLRSRYCIMKGLIGVITSCQDCWVNGTYNMMIMKPYESQHVLLSENLSLSKMLTQLTIMSVVNVPWNMSS